MTASAPPSRAKGACPICGRPTERRHKPFCSPRCQDVDLARWLTGAYVVQTEEEPEAEDDVVVRFPAPESRRK
ncbi:MAG: DNA gyrase inhibitor YacG [Alphaproteobacteria bacterium]|nr:DNA gyrase inhibitor YacG [Alphaproteobacteria bacterium]